MQRPLKRNTRCRNTRGLTLLELVVAVFVLSLGSIAAVRATDQSRLAIGGMETRVLAQIVARNRVQELQLYGVGKSAGLPTQVEMGGRRFTVQVARESTAGGLVRAEVSVRGPDGPGAYLVAYVTRNGPGQ